MTASDHPVVDQGADGGRPVRPVRHAARRWLMTLVAASAVAVVCGLIAASGDVPEWEADVFHVVNGLPDWLEVPMWLFQLAGLVLVPAVVAAAALAMRRWRLAAALVALIPIKLVIEKLVVKQLVERERPATSLCGGDETCLELRDAPVEGLSFVSGHAIIAWSVATVLWAVLPGRWLWIPVVVAGLNAVARVYLGAHNPLDVVGGAAIGAAIGALVVLVAGLAPAAAAERRTTQEAR